MANKGNAGIARLAAVMDTRMSEHQPNGLTVDFGEILPGYKLQANTFPVPIPPNDYIVCRQLTIGDEGDFLANVTTPEGTGRAHIPEKLRKLKPGDRVVVAWVQDTAVVLDIIMKADKI